MFALISRLVTRRPGVVVLTCFALAAALRSVAPGWDQVTKDDNVRFFPPDFPSVIGQALLERGFPRDAASSQVVLVYERQGRAADPAGLRLCRRHGRPVLPVRAGASGTGLQEARYLPIAGDRPAADRQPAPTAGARRC